MHLEKEISCKIPLPQKHSLLWIPLKVMLLFLIILDLRWNVLWMSLVWPVRLLLFLLCILCYSMWNVLFKSTVFNRTPLEKRSRIKTSTAAKRKAFEVGDKTHLTLRLHLFQPWSGFVHQLMGCRCYRCRSMLDGWKGGASGGQVLLKVRCHPATYMLKTTWRKRGGSFPEWDVCLVEYLSEHQVQQQGNLSHLSHFLGAFPQGPTRNKQVFRMLNSQANSHLFYTVSYSSTGCPEGQFVWSN